ncbi:hypothetical protein AMTR_s00021p00109520 [Amborella trichopoda]|uniref:Armadillo repeat-containing domain-containing protein n=1 Tax=Amborella trichopoda TaxID=13333 RepID=W1Q098_AMBTC|nr:hypothetical protein AMTR_s00021p00109520 [Amborella trichopoda]
MNSNKSLMLEAGITEKVTKLLEPPPENQTCEQLVMLLLLISATGQPHLNTRSSVIPSFLVATLVDPNTTECCKHACLSTLHNLCKSLHNIGPLVSNGSIPVLLRLLNEANTSERALATLANMVVTVTGKRAIKTDPLVPRSLIQALNANHGPKCQELAAYIIMALAHNCSIQREKMALEGVVPSLLEVALLGSPLAQKRAMKVLQWFKGEGKVAVMPHSGPQARHVRPTAMLGRHEREAAGDIKEMVKQSLNMNMEQLLKRANANSCTSGDGSKLKALVVSSSSKSLSY